MDIIKKARLSDKIFFISIILFLLISTIIPSFIDDIKGSSPIFIVILVLLFALGIASSILLAIGMSLLFNRILSKKVLKIDLELLAGILSFILFFPILFKFPEEFVRISVLIISP